MKQDTDAADTEFRLFIIQCIPLFERDRRFFYQSVDGGDRILGIGGPWATSHRKFIAPPQWKFLIFGTTPYARLHPFEFYQL